MQIQNESVLLLLFFFLQLGRICFRILLRTVGAFANFFVFSNRPRSIYQYSNMISICHYGGRPRFLAAPPLTLNLPLMASKETLEQVKNLLKQELSPINAKMAVICTL